jgi:hypothetical protein
VGSGVISEADKGKEFKGEIRKVYNEELYNLYPFFQHCYDD